MKGKANFLLKKRKKQEIYEKYHFFRFIKISRAAQMELASRVFEAPGLEIVQHFFYTETKPCGLFIKIK